MLNCTVLERNIAFKMQCAKPIENKVSTIALKVQKLRQGCLIEKRIQILEFSAVYSYVTNKAVVILLFKPNKILIIYNRPKLNKVIMIAMSKMKKNTFCCQNKPKSIKTTK